MKPRLLLAFTLAVLLAPRAVHAVSESDPEPTFAREYCSQHSKESFARVNYPDGTIRANVYCSTWGTYDRASFFNETGRLVRREWGATADLTKHSVEIWEYTPDGKRPARILGYDPDGKLVETNPVGKDGVYKRTPKIMYSIGDDWDQHPRSALYHLLHNELFKFFLLVGLVAVAPLTLGGIAIKLSKGRPMTTRAGILTAASVFAVWAALAAFNPNRGYNAHVLTSIFIGMVESEIHLLLLSFVIGTGAAILFASRSVRDVSVCLCLGAMTALIPFLSSFLTFFFYLAVFIWALFGLFLLFYSAMGKMTPAGNRPTSPGHTTK